jgi:hypothetical protein
MSLAIELLYWHPGKKRWRIRDPNDKWQLPSGLLLGKKIYPNKHHLNYAIWYRLRCLRSKPCQNWNFDELLIQKSLVCQALGRVGKQLASELACQWAIHQITDWPEISLPDDYLFKISFENTVEEINKWSSNLRILLPRHGLTEAIDRIDEECSKLHLGAQIGRLTRGMGATRRGD